MVRTNGGQGARRSPVAGNGQVTVEAGKNGPQRDKSTVTRTNRTAYRRLRLIEQPSWSPGTIAQALQLGSEIPYARGQAV